MKLSPDNDSIVNRPIDKTRTNVLIYDTKGNHLSLGQNEGENMRMKKTEKRDIIKENNEPIRDRLKKEILSLTDRQAEYVLQKLQCLLQGEDAV